MLAISQDDDNRTKNDKDDNADEDIIFEEEGHPSAVISVLQSLLSLPMDEMASATRDSIGRLNLKKTGSVNYETNHKLLLECWLTPVHENQ